MFWRLGSAFGSEEQAKWLQNGGKHGAISLVNAKLKNTDFSLYLTRFGEVGHPRKLTFFTNFCLSVSDPLPRGLLETTLPDFYNFLIHFGTPISSLLTIIFQVSKTGPFFSPNAKSRQPYFRPGTGKGGTTVGIPPLPGRCQQKTST